MTRSPLRRTLLVLALMVPAALVMGCPKKQAAVQDAEAVPAPADTPDVTELAPLTEDAGEDTGPPDAGKKWVGPGYNSNQLKIKACCNAMHAQAKQLGSSPEATQVQGAAVACDTFAAQVGPQGTAPELAQLRAILKSVKLPSACQF